MKRTHSISIPLPEWVVAAISALEDAGFEAWCVGGCVRDSIIGRPAKDYDIATDATWQQAQQAFTRRSFATHETGIKHGTLTVVIEDHAMEVTTYRSDGVYSDGRHPDEVTFVQSIEEDLARRDFTINALAYHPTRGLLDPFGGQEDLESGIIRCVGKPIVRFKEDALRILRGCRFAAQLGFSIDADTLQAMTFCKMALHHIAAERITAELQGMLCGEHIHDALLETFDVIVAVLPELCAMKGFEQHTPYHIYDVLEHTAYVLQYTPPYPLIRWAALLHDAGKPGAFFMDGDRGHFFGHAKLSVVLARSVLSRMCFSQSFVNDVLTLVRIHDDGIQPTPRYVKRALGRLNGRVDLFESLCELKRADAMAHSPQGSGRIELADALKKTLDDILASNEAFAVRDLAIDGNDIISMGINPGPEIGALLNQALDAVIDEKIPNDHDELLKLIKRYVEN